MTQAMPRPEYPRPQLVREQWLNLNGTWEFEFDDERIGDEQRWASGAKEFTRRIQVPFAYQSRLSGIGDPAFHDLVWYKRSFALPAGWAGQTILLHFGAVDYAATVWVNGQQVAYHEGGHTPFQADITAALRQGDNTVVVRAEDFSRDVTLPRGKQYWKENSASIFYTRTTGIWQTVWLEPVNRLHIKKLKFKPDIDNNEIQIRTFLNQAPAGGSVEARIDIRFKDEYFTSTTFSVHHAEETRTVRLHDINDHGMGRWWSPHKPNLYDVTVTLLVDGQPVDTLQSYFGMRKISVEAGKIMLNNRVYFMRLVLDQGYFPDGNLTAPSDEALKRDIELAKEMGFNGARKHQKIEDPRFLYWADRLGYLVWGEMANAYNYSEDYVRRITSEWQEAIERDYNHPSLVVWVPLNESWGVSNILVDKRQQQHALAMYHLTKSLDDTRLVVSNDGLGADAHGPLNDSRLRMAAGRPRGALWYAGKNARRQAPSPRAAGRRHGLREPADPCDRVRRDRLQAERMGGLGIFRSRERRGFSEKAGRRDGAAAAIPACAGHLLHPADRRRAGD